MATSFLTCHRQRRPRLVPTQSPPTEGKDDDGEEEEEEADTRDWAELPLDALLAVLQKLDHADVVMGAELVCRPWCRAAREEPGLWRRVDVCRRVRTALSSPHVNSEAIAFAAVRRGAGQCEAFRARGLRIGDSFVFFLTWMAPQLKSLRLISCYKISKQGLKEAIRKFNMLEELEVSLYSSGLSLTLSRIFCSAAVAEAEILAAAAEACLRLKHLRLNKHRFRWHSGTAGDSYAAEIAKMRGLRSLQLFGNSLSNAGLEAILRGCARLESLDIRHCFNVKMNDEARVMCARLQTLRPPDDSMHDYDLSFGSPEMGPAGIPHCGRGRSPIFFRGS